MSDEIVEQLEQINDNLEEIKKGFQDIATDLAELRNYTSRIERRLLENDFEIPEEENRNTIEE